MNQGNQPLVAYFCMEFGLHEDFRIYSGGLGILAGDILKAAKDGNYPMVGVGILWRQGYTTQVIREDGKLYDCFPEYNYDFLQDTGVIVEVWIRNRPVRLKVWKCDRFGNVPLYLLDANLWENADRLITGQLYGWFNEERIAQEIILGVGGVRALRALGIHPDVFHFNDSHPVVAGIELIREKMHGEGKSFEEAWDRTRGQIVFTTHTPIMAGNEVHGHHLLQYMGAYNGLDYNQMARLGGDPFGMTVAGLRLSRKANAVAELHGHTARNMWQHVEGGSSIIAVTNGVHNGTWQDSRIALASGTGADLWAPHQEIKREMLAEIAERNGVKLNENTLTIGFARRAAPYKRGDLIFRRPDVIEPLLNEGKLQLIFSGKAHPNDLEGKGIVYRLYEMSQRYPESVVFMQNYDMKIGKLLTRGCDVWLNNPVRPMEASGTSGMKAAMNGVLNFSILDGWWPEGCCHGVNGWQIGDGCSHCDQDWADADALYYVLLNDVIPTYYVNRAKWLEMMKASIEMSEWRFSAARMVREYYERMYRRDGGSAAEPAAQAG
jgi:starch phosphorylase